ncbi:hypothetical protein BCU83_14720 [Vibrio breoganii]|uniref:hypothetical protein n=1 Tax=Vibrio breoganii TaxID=553239 RepID=UPI000C828C76|nr:hypothetical protein [Vibrio breoganii]PMG78316.1 hypothetical protein BCU83_14720 [Vibrio breoganii]
MVTIKQSRMDWFKQRPSWQWILLILVVLALWGALSPARFMNFWLTKDQQGHIYFQQGDYAKAQSSFDSQEWKARSAYLAGDFQSAMTQLKGREDAKSKYLLANVFAYSNQFEQAKALYVELSQDPALQQEMQQNIEVMNASIEKLKNAPLEKKEGEKMIDDRNIATSEEEASEGIEAELSDQVWLKQVRQDPSKFLRQKFQQEYANEQE